MKPSLDMDNPANDLDNDFSSSPSPPPADSNQLYTLSSPSEGETFLNLEALLQFINLHAGPQGYAVVLARTKCSKKGVKRKAFVRCNRGGKSPGVHGERRIHESSRMIECPFSVVAKLEDCHWSFIVRNDQHNYDATLPGSYPKLRKLALTKQVQIEIARQTKIQVFLSSPIFEDSRLINQIAPSKILSGLRLGANKESPMFKARDVYNAKAVNRREGLGSLSPVQALMKELNGKEWDFNFQINCANRLTHLFFSRRSSQKILELNPEILVMNCTYKTNRYRMPLLVITGQTGLNTTFYVAFAFMDSEFTGCYQWVLQELKKIYENKGLAYPTVIVTNCERALANAIHLEFPIARHLFCIWHINNNVLTNCKRQFDTKEAWETFFSAWQKVVYASSFNEYINSWNEMNTAYNVTHSECMNYLNETYIRLYKTRFVQFYTNQKLHFGTVVSSRGEGAHAKLKRSLGVSISKLT